MKIERTRNASRNIVYGTLLKIYQLIIPFVMRTAMIYLMGVQYAGLNGLFSSILQVLNLAELGVGSAMTYSMYKPIVEDDSKKICALMRLYRMYYRIIGIVIAVAGAGITPLIPKLIKGSVPEGINIYVLYLLNLSATVLSYWLFAYKNSLLVAYQRNDITSKVTIITNSVQYILQFAVLYFFRNYYYFIIVMLLIQIVTNIATALVVNHIFPNYKAEGKLDNAEVNAINKKIRDLFTAKLGGVIVNSADTIVISSFLGLTMLTVYQNYYFLLSAVIGLVAIVYTSCVSGIGNSLIVETKEKNFEDFTTFTFMISWISAFGTCCFLALYQPFMEIWQGKEYTLSYSAVVFFSIYFYVYEINALLNMYKDAGGIWKEDKFRPLVTALSNLAMNLIMVQFWGIYGVLASTVISMILIGMPWIIHNLFSTLFDKSMIKLFLKKLFIYTSVSAIICLINTLICLAIPLERWWALIVRGIICVVLPNIILLLLFRKTAEFGKLLAIVDKTTKGKIPFLEKMMK